MLRLLLDPLRALAIAAIVPISIACAGRSPRPDVARPHVNEERQLREAAASYLGCDAAELTFDVAPDDAWRPEIEAARWWTVRGCGTEVELVCGELCLCECASPTFTCELSDLLTRIDCTYPSQ